MTSTTISIITTSYLARYLSRFPSPKIPPPPPSASLKVFESVWITVNFNFALFLGGRNESTQIKKSWESISKSQLTFLPRKSGRVS